MGEEVKTGGGRVTSEEVWKEKVRVGAGVRGRNYPKQVCGKLLPWSSLTIYNPPPPPKRNPPAQIQILPVLFALLLIANQSTHPAPGRHRSLPIQSMLTC